MRYACTEHTVRALTPRFCDSTFVAAGQSFQLDVEVFCSAHVPAEHSARLTAEQRLLRSRGRTCAGGLQVRQPRRPATPCEHTRSCRGPYRYPAVLPSAWQ